MLYAVEFDVLVSDLRMPGLMGIDLLRRSKQVSPRTEVIILTGDGEPGTEIECRKLGAFDFLQKPFETGPLLATVARAIEQADQRDRIERGRDLGILGYEGGSELSVLGREDGREFRVLGSEGGLKPAIRCCNAQRRSRFRRA